MGLRSRQFRRDRAGWLVASCLLLIGLSMGLVGGAGGGFGNPDAREFEPSTRSAGESTDTTEWSDDWSPTLRTIAWLGGHWQQKSGDGMIEELWMPARGGLMLGLHRTLQNRKATARFEFLRIEEREDGVFFIASVDGQQPTEYRLSEADYDHAVFTNPENDFPKRIEYERKGTTRLVALIWGKEAGPAWNFVRAGEIE